MKLYSQRDPSYKHMKLPKSNLTMGNYGCYVTSIAMLGQVEPPSLLRDELFAKGGLLYSNRMAKAAGMTYRGRSANPPKDGWCVGVTGHYRSSGFPTHFFLVHAGKGLQVDPLKENPKIEKLKYKCFDYRLFDGIKLPDPSVDNSEKIKKAIKLNSEAWKAVEEAQAKLHESNNLLRSL